jgi:DNA repair protein RadC
MDARTDACDPAALSMKHWPENERPREKLLHKGAEALSDTELLALLINAGNGGQSAMDIARGLLQRYASLRRLATRPVSELRSLHGIGPARAATLLAAFELGKRFVLWPDEDAPKITSPDDVFRLYMPRLRDLCTERFVAILLNNGGRVIREHIVSEGIVNASLVHPREVFKAAIAESATSVILLHNHPSGVREASKEDHAVTRQLVDAGKIMGIPVQDHVIICGSQYISFAESGWI